MATKGELIVASMKLMFDNNDEQLDATTISSNTDPNYRARTVNIVESINRALSEIMKADTLPRKTVEFTKVDGDIGTYFTRYDLDSITITNFSNDVFKVRKVNYEYLNKYETKEIRLEGENILILPTIDKGKYIITYSPTITRLSYTDQDTTTVNIPNDLADIIPLFVKGDLYEEDKPNEALMAKNMFFASLNNRPKKSNETQTRITTRYSQIF